MKRLILVLGVAAFSACSGCGGGGSSSETASASAAPPVTETAATPAGSNWDRAWALVEAQNRYIGVGNTEGFLGVARPAVIQALVMRYQQTGDERHLTAAEEQVRDILALRASETGATDYRGQSRPAWLYRLASGGRVYPILHAGNVSRTIVDFALVARGVPAFAPRADGYAAAALAAMQSFETEYDTTYSAYRWPADFPTDEHFARGRIITVNQNALAALAWERLGTYYGRPDWIARFDGYMQFFKTGGVDHLFPDTAIPGIETKPGPRPYASYVYDPYLPPANRQAEDVLHLSWTLEAVLQDATTRQRVFGNADLDLFAGTVERFIASRSPVSIMARLDEPATANSSLAMTRSFARIPYFPGIKSRLGDDVRAISTELIAGMLLDASRSASSPDRTDYFNSAAFLLNYVAWAE